MLAHNKIQERNQFDGLELTINLDELWGRGVFFRVVVGGVAEVEVPVDLLVQICSFFVVVRQLRLEEVRGCGFHSQDNFQLLLNSLFVEVAWVVAIKKSDSEFDVIPFFE